MNDLLIASLAVAVRRWNDAHDLEPRRLNVQVPINLRPREWFTEVVSNLATDVNIEVPHVAQRDLAAAQLTVARQTGVVKKRRADSELGTGAGLDLIPFALRYRVARRLQRGPSHDYTVALSNLGRVETFPDLAHDAGPVTELWFAPPGTAALGTLAGAITLRDEMFLTLHYRTAELDRAGTRAFAETWRDVLVT